MLHNQIRLELFFLTLNITSKLVVMSSSLSRYDTIINMKKNLSIQLIVNFIELQANCIDSTAPAEAVVAQEVKKLQQEKVKPLEQVTLEPYERDHAVVVGIFRYLFRTKSSYSV